MIKKYILELNLHHSKLNIRYSELDSESNHNTKTPSLLCPLKELTKAEKELYKETAKILKGTDRR